MRSKKRFLLHPGRSNITQSLEITLHVGRVSPRRVQIVILVLFAELLHLLLLLEIVSHHGLSLLLGDSRFTGGWPPPRFGQLGNYLGFFVLPQPVRNKLTLRQRQAKRGDWVG